MSIVHTDTACPFIEVGLVKLSVFGRAGVGYVIEHILVSRNIIKEEIRAFVIINIFVS